MRIASPRPDPARDIRVSSEYTRTQLRVNGAPGAAAIGRDSDVTGMSELSRQARGVVHAPQAVHARNKRPPPAGHTPANC